MSTFSDIKETLAEIPAIDAHEHICDFRDCNPQTSVVEFMTGGWMGLVMHPIPESLTEAEKWACFLDQWPLIKGTAPGSILCRILRAWDIDDDLAEGSKTSRCCFGNTQTYTRTAPGRTCSIRLLPNGFCLVPLVVSRQIGSSHSGGTTWNQSNAR